MKTLITLIFALLVPFSTQAQAPAQSTSRRKQW